MNFYTHPDIGLIKTSRPTVLPKKELYRPIDYLCPWASQNAIIYPDEHDRCDLTPAIIYDPRRPGRNQHLRDSYKSTQLDRCLPGPFTLTTL